MLTERLHDSFEQPRRVPAVIVWKSHNISGNVLQSDIASFGQAHWGVQVKDGKAVIIRLEDRREATIGILIRNNQFKVRVPLSIKRGQEPLQLIGSPNGSQNQRKTH
jgi:hypothetical protein